MSHEIRSPIPGIFYRRPAPDQDPFVEVGSVVAPDTQVALVEVMKNFHEVLAGVAGTVLSIEVEDSAMVGPGDVLMTLELDEPAANGQAH
ncbi:MAG: biotin carboxyl carrier domain-containing protein [Actinomycetia bacterium]|nr:biotin carboxyl carrier domain-containing protein [Actinomycetes bacterium]